MGIINRGINLLHRMYADCVVLILDYQSLGDTRQLAQSPN